MIYFFLFFQIHITQGDHLSIKTLSLSKRVLIYFHSKKNDSDFNLFLNKQWYKFAEMLEKDKKTGTYDVDYDENIEFCEYFLVKENDLPCFLVFDNKAISLFTKIDFTAAYNALNSTALASNTFLDENDQIVFQKLLNNYTSKNLLKTICPSFYPESANYPTFVFHSGDIQHCKKIRKYSHLFPQISDHFYFSSSVSAGVFYFYMNEKDYIFKKIKTSTIIKNIREYSFFPFEKFWGLKDIRQIKERRVAFIVYSNKQKNPLFDSNTEINQSYRNQSSQIINKNTKEIENENLRNMIFDLSNLFWKDIVFNKITLNEYNLLKAKMTEDDTPFIFVTNPRKSKFMIFKNITLHNRNKIISELKKIKRGVYDGEMSYTFEPILSVFYEHSRSLYNTLCFTFVALVVVTVTTVVIVKRASRCINPYNQVSNRRKHMF